MTPGDFQGAITKGYVRDRSQLKALFRKWSKLCHPDLTSACGLLPDFTFVELQERFWRAWDHPQFRAASSPAAAEGGCVPSDSQGDGEGLLDLYCALVARGFPQEVKDPASRRRRESFFIQLDRRGVEGRKAEAELRALWAGRKDGPASQDVKDLLYLAVSRHFNPMKVIVLQWNRRAPKILAAMRKCGAMEAADLLELLWGELG